MEIDYKKSYRYSLAKKRVKDLRGFYVHLLVYLFVNTALLILITRDEGLWKGLEDLSNFTTAFFWGIGLLAHASSVLGPDVLLGKKWEKRKIQELLDKEKGNLWE